MVYIQKYYWKLKMSLNFFNIKGVKGFTITPKNGSCDLSLGDEKTVNAYFDAYYNKRDAEVKNIEKLWNIHHRAACAIWYVSQRSRGTSEHIMKLRYAAKIPNFDWDSVFRGEEYTELAKFGL
jgi:hypothetical protein